MTHGNSSRLDSKVWTTRHREMQASLADYVMIQCSMYALALTLTLTSSVRSTLYGSGSGGTYLRYPITVKLGQVWE